MPQGFKFLLQLILFLNMIILAVKYKIKDSNMNIPFVDLKANYLSIKEEIDAAIKDVLENTGFIVQKEHKSFEKNWAKACNAGYCCATSSGTSSLEIILKAYGTGRGDKVLCPSHTFIATAEAIVNAGADPVFAEVNPETGLIDPVSVSGLIDDSIKAIIIVDIYGQPADYYKIREAAGKDMLIIQDAAQSHLGKYKGRVVGSYADVTSFSFYPGKNLGAYGDAGAVVTDNKELAEKISMLTNHGRKLKYEHELVGTNYRMDNLQAAILDVKLKYLDKWVESRRNIASLYRKLLDKNIQIIEELETNKAAYHLFVIKVKNRDKLAKYLKEKNISSGVHYPVPLHLQPAFSYLGYKKGDFIHTEKLSEEILSLPIYPEMTEDMVKYVADCVNKFVRK